MSETAYTMVTIPAAIGYRGEVEIERWDATADYHIRTLSFRIWRFSEAGVRVALRRKILRRVRREEKRERREDRVQIYPVPVPPSPPKKGPRGRAGDSGASRR